MFVSLTPDFYTGTLDAAHAKRKWLRKLAVTPRTHRFGFGV
ncbi:hypothetical protein [Limimaricola litoreus]